MWPQYKLLNKTDRINYSIKQNHANHRAKIITANNSFPKYRKRKGKRNESFIIVRADSKLQKFKWTELF